MLSLFFVLALTSIVPCKPDAIAHHDVNCKDMKIELERVTNDHIKLRPSLNSIDPGFQKWFILMHGFPKHVDLEISYRRLFQDDPDHFESMVIGSLDEEGCFISQQRVIPHVCISENGFFPGEPVVVRVATKDLKICKEREFIPRPIVAYKPTGEVLFEFKLCSLKPITQYYMTFPGVSQNEKIIFKSYSKHEKVEKVLDRESVMLPCIPGVLEYKGGSSIIDLLFENGERYIVSVPWGTEFVKYIMGEKFLPLVRRASLEESIK
jgi:hypothetical protein